MTDLSPRQQALKEKFIKERGYWKGVWAKLLEVDTDFFEAYLDFTAIPTRHGYLEPYVRELLYIAIDISTTHLYEPGLRVHIRNALALGRSPEEIMEVYELTAAIGMHSMSMGVPALRDELKRAGREMKPLSDGELSARQKELKAQFEREVGPCEGEWQQMLEMDPDFFKACLDFTAVPWRNGKLSPKIKEFVYIAVDAATTHLYEPGLKLHIRKALKLGATPQEVMEVLECSAVLGMHTIAMGLPAMLDEMEKAKARAPAQKKAG
ncbi:MAG: carboxymuconolactone decarboxylase family protein [Alphaproteobacteria bacterium]